LTHRRWVRVDRVDQVVDRVGLHRWDREWDLRPDRDRLVCTNLVTRSLSPVRQCVLSDGAIPVKVPLTVATEQ